LSRAKARLLKENILVFNEGRTYEARPEGWDSEGVLNTIKRTFTLKYHMFDEQEKLVSIVQYNFFHNYLLVKRDTGDRQIKIPVFDLNNQRYYIKEKISGFLIFPVDKVSQGVIIGEGTKSMKEYSIEFVVNDDNFNDILKEFAAGFLIRWMSFNIGI